MTDCVPGLGFAILTRPASEAMSDDCLFCKIVAGEIPSTEIYSDDEFYGFKDINPAAPHHVLIVPRKHLATITDASSEDEGLLGRLLLRGNEVARRLGVVDGGFRYVINCGDHGGQTVYHLHLHLVGGRPLSWPPG